MRMQNSPLNDSQILNRCPSIFAQEAHISRSERYSYVPTANILTALRKEGFEVFSAKQACSRTEEKRGFTKHMVRLRHLSQINANNTDANEIVLINSHDGSSSYQMMSGVFRFVCLNGLVCGTKMNDIRVPHKGDISGRIIEGAYEVLNNFKAIDAQKDEMKGLVLSEQEQRIFANSALEMKYGEEEPPIDSSQILRLRRAEDNKNDLWTTFNRVQENLIRGGLIARGQGRRRYTRTRAVNGIDQDVKLNRALWTLAERMKILKAN